MAFNINNLHYTGPYFKYTTSTDTLNDIVGAPNYFYHVSSPLRTGTEILVIIASDGAGIYVNSWPYIQIADVDPGDILV